MSIFNYENIPRAAWLTVNRKCNFRCKWCYAENTGYGKKEMTLGLAKNLFALCHKIGVKKFLIIGGEPTLWKHLIEFNRFCTENNAETILVTNGVKFGNNNFWEKYLKFPNNQISLSLKAGNDKDLKSFTGFSNFDLLTKGISRAVNQLNANISITYNSCYKDSLINMAHFAKKCGAKTLKIDFCSTVFIDEKPYSTYMVDPQEMVKNILEQYDQIDNIFNGCLVFEMMVPFCIWPKDFIEKLKIKGQILSVCHVHKKQGIIFDEEGNLLICNALFNYPMGKYGIDFTDDTFLSWINKKEISDVQNRLRCYPSIKCCGCKWYSDCGGGCPLRWTIYNPENIVTPI
ncbi:MAG: radical SAM protein [Candidatus Pacebacteria bacterium]|nr:radical SAM protein [Candidatus Paceibacterota bacterium]